MYVPYVRYMCVIYHCSIGRRTVWELTWTWTWTWHATVRRFDARVVFAMQFSAAEGNEIYAPKRNICRETKHAEGNEENEAYAQKSKSKTRRSNVYSTYITVLTVSYPPEDQSLVLLHSRLPACLPACLPDCSSMVVVQRTYI